MCRWTLLSVTALALRTMLRSDLFVVFHQFCPLSPNIPDQIARCNPVLSAFFVMVTSTIPSSNGGFSDVPPNVIGKVIFSPFRSSVNFITSPPFQSLAAFLMSLNVSHRCTVNANQVIFIFIANPWRPMDNQPLICLCQRIDMKHRIDHIMYQRSELVHPTLS